MARAMAIAKAADFRDGSMAPIEVDGHRVGLVMFAGAFYAFDDHCPHAGSTLALGTIHDNAIECPRHEFLWRITDGKALVTGENMIMFRVWVDGEKVMMDVPDTWPEPAHLRRHPKRAELRRKFGYDEPES